MTWEGEGSHQRTTPSVSLWISWEPNLRAIGYNGPVSRKQCLGIWAILGGGKIGALLFLEIP